MNPASFVIGPSSSAERPVSRVAMYARVSSERQADEATIESQIAAIGCGPLYAAVCSCL